MTRRNLLLVGLGSAIVLADVAWIVWPEPEPPRPPDRTGPTPTAAPSPTLRPSRTTPEMREKIDRWLRERGLDEYGDPPGTASTGGTPLFDETTGVARDRYEYLEEKMNRPEPTAAPTGTATPSTTPTATGSPGPTFRSLSVTSSPSPLPER